MRMILISLLAIATPACGQAEDGDGLVPALERLAARDDAEAIYHLGMAYQTGSGVTLDHGKALEHFRHAESLGDPLAAYKLGCFYAGQDAILEPDPAKALRYKLVAAKAGYALAQQDVAKLYFDSGDPVSATEWLAKAAAQGTSDALMAFASVHNGAAGFARSSDHHGLFPALPDEDRRVGQTAAMAS